jgi:hypothetical protein
MATEPVIYGSTASGINGISITAGCIFQNQVNSGIYVGQSSSTPGTWSNVTISNSTFSGNGVSGGGNGAIYAEKLSGATITGNVHDRQWEFVQSTRYQH